MSGRRYWLMRTVGETRLRIQVVHEGCRCSGCRGLREPYILVEGSIQAVRAAKRLLSR